MIEREVLEPTLLEIIEFIYRKYSKKEQWGKAIEEAEEYLDELCSASNPFGYENCVYLGSGAWSESADVIITVLGIAMQHGKLEEVRREIEYKLHRQVERMTSEGKLSVEEYSRYQVKGEEYTELIERMEREK